MRPSHSSRHDFNSHGSNSGGIPRNHIENTIPEWKQERDAWREKMDAWKEKRDALREERKELRENGEWRENRDEWREARKELMEERKALMEEKKDWMEERQEWREEQREERRKRKEEKEKENSDNEGTDTGGTDTGGTDTGGTDTGGTDTGGTDTGGTDTGGTDTGGTDTGGTDTGGTDTGGTDTGGTGTGGTDTGGTDTGGEEAEEPQVLTEYTSSAEGSDFNIHIDFIGEWTLELQDAFITSADYLSSVVTGDLTDTYVNGQLVDDLTITAELANIDGAGGILGQAGPTYIRSADYLPVAGMMQFDDADAENFFNLGQWDSIVLHEMTHTLGFGAMWSFMGLASGLGTDNPTFTGTNATAVYEKTFGLTDTNGVPIENDGGAGTAGAHWEESLFGTDLMSGYLTSGTQPELSDLSIASLEDMGYDTVFDYDTFMAS